MRLRICFMFLGIIFDRLLMAAMGVTGFKSFYAGLPYMLALMAVIVVLLLIY